MSRRRARLGSKRRLEGDQEGGAEGSQVPMQQVMVFSCSVVSSSLRLHGLQPSRLLCPWDFPGKNTGVGCHFLLQGIFATQGSSWGILHWQVDSLPLSYQGNHPPQLFGHTLGPGYRRTAQIYSNQLNGACFSFQVSPLIYILKQSFQSILLIHYILVMNQHGSCRRY